MPNLNRVNYFLPTRCPGSGDDLVSNGISILSWSEQPLDVSIPQLINTTNVAIGGSIGK